MQYKGIYFHYCDKKALLQVYTKHDLKPGNAAQMHLQRKKTELSTEIIRF